MTLPLNKRFDIVNAGQYCFAIAITAFGLQHYIFGDFTTGRAPAYPSLVPGKIVWAYVSGMVLIVGGIMIGMKRRAREAALVIGSMIFFWALLRHILVWVNLEYKWGGELTQLCKALTLFGGSVAVAATLPRVQGNVTMKGLINQTNSFILLGRFCLGIFMIIAGIQHFLFVDFVKSLVPAWIPGNIFWTYFSAIALIAGGAGLMLNKTVLLAALLTGIMVFTWFVILHIPRAVTLNDDNEWISVFESLAVSGIAFVLAGFKGT